jgi:hypothetical protein
VSPCLLDQNSQLLPAHAKFYVVVGDGPIRIRIDSWMYKYAKVQLCNSPTMQKFKYAKVLLNAKATLYAKVRLCKSSIMQKCKSQTLQKSNYAKVRLCPNMQKSKYAKSPTLHKIDYSTNRVKVHSFASIYRKTCSCLHASPARKYFFTCAY